MHFISKFFMKEIYYTLFFEELYQSSLSWISKVKSGILISSYFIDIAIINISPYALVTRKFRATYVTSFWMGRRVIAWHVIIVYVHNLLIFQTFLLCMRVCVYLCTYCISRFTLPSEHCYHFKSIFLFILSIFH